MFNWDGCFVAREILKTYEGIAGPKTLCDIFRMFLILAMGLSTRRWFSISAAVSGAYGRS